MKRSSLIFIVDDDKSVRCALDSLVRSLGYSTKLYHSGDEFIAEADLSRVDCLITDLQMPGIDGFELQDILAQKMPRIPIIFITAFYQEKLKTQALQNGAVSFLSKPFGASQIIESIESALKKGC